MLARWPFSFRVWVFLEMLPSSVHLLGSTVEILYARTPRRYTALSYCASGTHSRAAQAGGNQIIIKWFSTPMHSHEILFYQKKKKRMKQKSHSWNQPRPVLSTSWSIWCESHKDESGKNLTGVLRLAACPTPPNTPQRNRTLAAWSLVGALILKQLSHWGQREFSPLHSPGLEQQQAWSEHSETIRC